MWKAVVLRAECCCCFKVPLKHADAALNVDFDANLLFDTLPKDQMGIASVGALRGMAEGVQFDQLDKLSGYASLFKGVASAKIISYTGALVDLDFGGVLPLFQILPEAKEAEDDDDSDDDWE